METSWLTIQEYSNRHGISISTIRRKIKAGGLKHSFKNGRYLIQDTATSFEGSLGASEMKSFYQREIQNKQEQIQKLASQLKSQEQEINKLIAENKDLNQLVQILEDQIQKRYQEPTKEHTLD